MESFVREHEGALRLGAFVGVFALLAVWESARPRRGRSIPRRRRWPANLGLVALGTLAARLCFPAAAVGMAALARERGWGLFQELELPAWLEIALSLLALDLAIFGQHVLFHAVPLLWRLHRVHHTDLELDVTTGFRFHPLELVLSLAFKLALVAALGAPLAAVFLFEVVLNAFALFTHANARIVPGLDRALRWLVVTPDMHRVHHSVIVEETNSNYGFHLSCWDRLFRTYREQPREGHARMTIGLVDRRDPREVARLLGTLAMPFRARA